MSGTGSILMQQAGQYSMWVAVIGIALLGFGIYRAYSHGIFQWSMLSKILIVSGILMLILAGVSQAYTKAQVSKVIAG